jgi:hypothetical protein
MVGAKGEMVVTLEIDEGYPTVDVNFPDGGGQYWTNTVDKMTKIMDVPEGHDVVVTTGTA